MVGKLSSPHVVRTRDRAQRRPPPHTATGTRTALATPSIAREDHVTNVGASGSAGHGLRALSSNAVRPRSTRPLGFVCPDREVFRRGNDSRGEGRVNTMPPAARKGESDAAVRPEARAPASGAGMPGVPRRPASRTRGPSRPEHPDAACLPPPGRRTLRPAARVRRRTRAASTPVRVAAASPGDGRRGNGVRIPDGPATVMGDARPHAATRAVRGAGKARPGARALSQETCPGQA